jgi:hypothetical protein
MASEPVSTPKPTPHKAEQDQQMANYITEALQRLEVARDDAEIAPLIAARGYNTTRLAEGLAVQKAAQDAFTARQTAMAAQSQAVAACDGAELTARSTYADYRTIAGGVFTVPADRAAVGLKGAVPDDMQKFITLAHSSYDNAKNEPYQTALAVYGYAPATLDAALATLDVFTTAIEAQASAVGAAVRSTAARNEAVKALKVWMRMFDKVASVALKNRPDLLKKLGL